MAPIQDNNVNMTTDERPRREPNSASESADAGKNNMTPTKKKILERANKLKKFPIEVDPEYVLLIIKISLFHRF